MASKPKPTVSARSNTESESPEGVVQEVIEKLEKEVICSHCKNQYQTPKILQCCHVFCEKCLAVDESEIAPVAVNCLNPECGNPTTLPKNGIRGLLPAVHVHRLFEILGMLKKVSIPAKPVCKNCKKSDASCYCQTCGCICDACAEVHSGWESHEIVGLNHLTSDVTGDSTCVCLEKCYAEGPGLHVAMVGEAATATVYVVDKEGKEYQCLVEVSCKLVSSDGSTQAYDECRQIGTSNGYKITYQPLQRGQHSLYLQVAGKHLSKSEVCVLSTEPVRTLQFNIRNPSQFAITDKGQAVVSCGNAICIHNPNGDQLRSFGSSASTGQLSGASGIVLTANGNILVCDSSNDRVRQFSFAGQLVKCVGSSGSAPLQFSKPVGIGVHPLSQKVYVVEQINHRVQILNSDLTFVSMFGSRGTENGQFINPCDVAFNSCGDVFVLDRDNLRIQVFTSGGKYVWQFTKREHIEGGLKNPRSIAIDSGDRVYITEQGNHCISIFSPDGVLVMLFGKQGTEAGQFVNVRGVDFDNAGDMYIMDELSSTHYQKDSSVRIQVFHIM